MQRTPHTRGGRRWGGEGWEERRPEVGGGRGAIGHAGRLAGLEIDHLGEANTQGSGRKNRSRVSRPTERVRSLGTSVRTIRLSQGRRHRGGGEHWPGPPSLKVGGSPPPARIARCRGYVICKIFKCAPKRIKIFFFAKCNEVKRYVVSGHLL